MSVNESNYAFIDGQNLYETLGRQGKNIKYHRLRELLARRYNVTKAIIYLGEVEPTILSSAYRSGMEVVRKQAVRYIDKAGKAHQKNNIDIDLAVGVLGKYTGQYDRAVVVSGDGDFAPLYWFLIRQDKLKRIIAPSREESSTLLRGPELRKYTAYLSDIDTLADLLIP